KRVAIVRHPMPYGDLMAQAVQRFATMEDLERAHCTIEEREEYEPIIRDGAVVFAGVDYEPILRRAEAEADIVIWDGGNNDLPFYAPNLMFTVADPYRAGHEMSYYPGEANFRMANVIVISKTDSAPPEAVQTIEQNAARANPSAKVLLGGLKLISPEAERLRGIGRSSWRTDRPSLTVGSTRAPARSSPSATVLRSSTHDRSRSVPSPASTRTTRTSSGSSPRWGTARRR